MAAHSRPSPCGGLGIGSRDDQSAAIESRRRKATIFPLEWKGAAGEPDDAGTLEAEPRWAVGERAFAIGCVIYGCGSFTTAIAPNLPVLLFGWSFLEGVGAALILPAIVALVAGDFPTERRPAA